MALKVPQLTSEQLSKSETLEKIKAIADDIAVHDQMPSAWELAKKLERQTRSLVDSSPEIHKQYQRIIAQLKFVAISFLTDEQLLQLIEKHYLKALKKGVEVVGKIKDYLTIKSIFIWDQFRREVITHLKRNQEKIGNKSIKEWLNNYDREFGARKNTSMERTKFMSKSSEAKSLDGNEQRQLSSALTFYDYIKTSPPLPYLNISEVSLKEYFRELGVPLPEEEQKKKIKIPPHKKPEPPVKQQKPKQEKKKQKPEPPAPPQKKETKQEKSGIFSPWKKKISPYEKERKIYPSLPKKEKVKSKPEPKSKPRPKQNLKQKPEPGSKPVKIPPHEIRTMKQDLEQAKKEPIPEKPKPKEGHVVDLSKKKQEEQEEQDN